MAGAESYPEDLKYHPEHDWARIEGDEAVLGHHVVGAGRARRARPLRGARGRRLDREGRGLRRGRVGQGRLRRDRAALGRDPRGEREGGRGARVDQRRPVRRGLARADPAHRPDARSTTCSTSRRTGRSWPSNDRRVPLAHRSRPRRDARRDRRLLDRRAVRADPGGRALRPRARRAAGADRGRARAPLRGARGEERAHRRRALVPRRRASTTTTCRRSSTRSCSAASS